jgi:hypothetical protein
MIPKNGIRIFLRGMLDGILCDVPVGQINYGNCLRIPLQHRRFLIAQMCNSTRGFV